MYLDYLVPSWFEIESRVTDHMGYQGGAHFRTYSNEPVASLALNLRRVDSVRKAFIHAEWQAAYLLRQRFAELDINSMYGFIPAIMLGGPDKLGNLEKVKIVEHLIFLSQLTTLKPFDLPEL